MTKHKLSCLMSFILLMGLSSKVFGSPFNARFKVAILDTGLDMHSQMLKDVLCPSGHKDFTGTGMYDNVGHGTSVASVVANNAPDHSKYCLVILKITNQEKGTSIDTISALVYAKSLGVSINNLSYAGPGRSSEEQLAIDQLGMMVVAAAGNTNTDYHKTYPAGYKNVVPVGNWDCKNHRKESSSNYGEGIVWRCGTDIRVLGPHDSIVTRTGTSFAAPLYVAEEINRRTKESD